MESTLNARPALPNTIHRGSGGSDNLRISDVENNPQAEDAPWVRRDASIAKVQAEQVDIGLVQPQLPFAVAAYDAAM
jgi:hypothetical protein